MFGFGLGVTICVALLFRLVGGGDAGTVDVRPRVAEEAHEPAHVPAHLPRPAAAVEPSGLQPEADLADGVATDPEVATPDAPAPLPALHGRVTRLADGSPLAGWTVFALMPNGFGLRAHSPIGADGGFRLEGVPAWVRELHVGLPRSAKRIVVQNFAPRPARIELPANPFDRPLELVADTGWIAEGTVVSSHGGVPADAWVEWRGARTVRSEVGVDGRFRLLDIQPTEPDGFTGEIGAGAPLHADHSLAWRLFEHARIEPGIRILLDGGVGALAGRLLDPDGARVPGRFLSLLEDVADLPAKLVARHEIGAIMGKQGAHTPRTRGQAMSKSVDASSEHYRLEGLAPGIYSVLVEPANASLAVAIGAFRRKAPTEPQLQADRDATLEAQHAPAPVMVREVIVRAGETTRLDVVFPWGGSVEGVVRDLGGTPVPGVLVRATQETYAAVISEVDESTLRALDPQEWAEVRLEELSWGPTVVVDRESGQAVSDAEGRFVIGQLPAGNFHVTAFREGADVLRGRRPVNRLGEGEARVLDLVVQLR